MAHQSHSALQLYRRILRLHRQLPSEIKYLGDQYVKSEFRRHQHVKDEKYLQPFFKEWNRYAEMLHNQISSKGNEKQGLEANVGTRLTKTELDKFSNEQIGQLFELKRSIKSPHDE